ncbi:MAG: 4-hydroxy-tetrahydrodipicolinate synthase [Proteobacteria bacterium]|nr:4-hydroxy-tetrahydrodipicolinate synthase [Pseudomonadota bacterium]
MFQGIYTALVTPMRNGTVDLSALARLIERQVAAGVQGVVVCATTGEGTTLTQDERRLVLESAVRRAGGKIQVLFGTSLVATWAVIDAVNSAADQGAVGALVSSPSYVKPSQDGIYGHYAAIADQSKLPIVLYNVPSRTASDIKPETVARLAAHDRVVAIKEASGSIERAQQIVAAAGDTVKVLSGDDPLTLSILVAGGHGVISTAANVVPEKWSALWRHWLAGDIQAAAAAQAGLLGLHGALFAETNPGPVKAALHLLGLLEDEVRLPLTWPSRPTVYRLAAELEKLGLALARSSQ